MSARKYFAILWSHVLANPFSTSGICYEFAGRTVQVACQTHFQPVLHNFLISLRSGRLIQDRFAVILFRNWPLASQNDFRSLRFRMRGHNQCAMDSTDTQLCFEGDVRP